MYLYMYAYVGYGSFYSLAVWYKIFQQNTLGTVLVIHTVFQRMKTLPSLSRINRGLDTLLLHFSKLNKAKLSCLLLASSSIKRSVSSLPQWNNTSDELVDNHRSLTPKKGAGLWCPWTSGSKALRQWASSYPLWYLTTSSSFAEW